MLSRILVSVVRSHQFVLRRAVAAPITLHIGLGVRACSTANKVSTSTSITEVDDAEAARQVSLLLEQEAEAEVEEQDQPKKKTTKRERKEMEDAIDFLLAAQKEWEAMQGENRKQMAISKGKDLVLWKKREAWFEGTHETKFKLNKLNTFAYMHVFTASPALSEAVIKEMDDDFGLILPKSLEIRIPTMHTKHIAPGTPYRVTAVRDDDDEFSADGMSLEVRTLADKYLFSVDADQILDKLACDPLAASQRALDPYKRWVVFAAYFRHLDTLVDPNAPEDEFDEEFDEFDEDSEIEEHK